MAQQNDPMEVFQMLLGILTDSEKSISMIPFSTNSPPQGGHETSNKLESKGSSSG